MTDPENPPTAEDREEAREGAVQRLGLVSMAIWVLVVVAFMWFVFPNRPFKPTIGMMLGSVAFALALVPWAAYPTLVERLARQRAAARGPRPLPPASR